MGNISVGLRNKLLDHVLKNTAYVPSATVNISLHTADPGQTGANEAAYTNYARTAITFGAAALRKVVQAASVIAFPTCGATGGTYTHYGIWSTDGTPVFMAGGLLETGGIVVVNGNTPQIAASEVEISFSAGTTMGISTYLVHALLDRAFRNQVFAQPTGLFLALTTAAVVDASTGATITEVANANAYARLSVPTWDAAASGASQNTAIATWITPTGSWGTIVAAALVDNSTHLAGNVLFYGNDVVDQLVGNGDTVQFQAGAFDIALT